MDALERLAEKAEARKLYMRDYMNKYYVDHKEKILADQLRSNTANREKRRESWRAWYARKKLLETSGNKI
jgi:hypothetical protein